MTRDSPVSKAKPPFKLCFSLTTVPGRSPLSRYKYSARLISGKTGSWHDNYPNDARSEYHENLLQRDSQPRIDPDPLAPATRESQICGRIPYTLISNTFDPRLHFPRKSTDVTLLSRSLHSKTNNSKK